MAVIGEIRISMQCEERSKHDKLSPVMMAELYYRQGRTLESINRMLRAVGSNKLATAGWDGKAHNLYDRFADIG